MILGGFLSRPFFCTLLFAGKRTLTTLQNTIGNTPLIRLQCLTPANGSEIWLKLGGNNPAGSVKDRDAWSMIHQAELRGDIAPGDWLIEATSGSARDTLRFGSFHRLA
nr:Sulfate/thiosulfate import ATP-binding protein CysA [Candidatus Pantoea persica]